MIRFALTLAAAAVALAACNTPLDAPLQGNLGQAVASMDAQIIPAEVSDAPPQGSGIQGTRAVDRYQTDKVKQPAVEATSSLVISGGDGGANSGGDSSSSSGVSR